MMMQTEGDVIPEHLGSLWQKAKSQQVRAVFENAPHYLKGRQVDIRFRSESVKKFSEKAEWQRLLDIGCGDGSISLQLLSAETQLTLLDISKNMTTIAQENVPKSLAKNVEIRNENFLAAGFAGKTFDLVISVGVMAHVDSPDAFLAKIRSLMCPGGTAIIEFTDCRHFMGRLERLTSDFKELIRPGKFRTNRLSYSQVGKLFESHGLKVASTFRYAMIPIPGIQKMINPKLLYWFLTLIFGDCTRNRNSYLGNEYICLLRAE
jgi:2-polyprenyl-3-methyl-5-hydroxy-6-metoxy-1,4-benzoquinol methylase